MDLLTTCGNFPGLLEDILDSVQQAVILADADGEVLFISRMFEEISGFELESLKKRKLANLFTSEDLVYLYPNLLYLARMGQTFEGEMLLRRKNGSSFFAFLTMKPHAIRDGSSHVIIFCIQDIDKQKHFERTLRETHFEDLIRIANGIAHEIRNPIVGIGGFASRLYKECQVDSTQEQYYGYIINNLNKIENLVKKVDYLVSLPKPEFTKASLVDVIETAVEPYLADAGRRGLVISITAPDTMVLLDKEHVIRAVAILVENAIDAVEDGGHIRINGHAGPVDYRISVTDNGSGIAEGDLPFVFNPFFSTKADGAGIDLAVVKRIVESHGGRVEVTSTPGEGAWFVLHFPYERRREIRVSLLEQKSAAGSSINT